jgi:hypothetical protein
MKSQKKVVPEKKNKLARVKKPYIRPELTIHGDVKEITKSVRKVHKSPQVVIS